MPVGNTASSAPPAQLLETGCCVVGAGPGGMMLSLLLARAGVAVTLLEAHRDFDRDFRGDTIHPATLEVLEQIGLAARVHELPHVKALSFRFVSARAVDTVAVFSRLPTRFPYMMIMPQARFLEFLAAEAARYPHFRLVTGAHVDRLVEEGGRVAGVGYRQGDDQGEVKALLTVAADGRFSRLRKLAGMEPISQSGPMEVLWFRLPRRAGDRYDEAAIAVGDRQLIAVLARTQEWQLGYIGPQGRFREIRSKGIEAFRRSVAEVLPWLTDRVELLRDFSDVSLLSVEGSRLVRWHRPGLLLIGDAAHVMLPVGGVGINCAIADAVEAVNVLAGPLRAGQVDERQLAEVQRRREGLTRIIQGFQARVQGGMTAAFEAGRAFRLPLPVRMLQRIPFLRDLAPRITAFGVRRARLEHPVEFPAARPET
jgi:2-polyprenyl-6-methoxyphenol hydroxylase-like FAD-dependent oxidoreductase